MFVRSPTVGEQVCVRYENEPEALFTVVPAEGGGLAVVATSGADELAYGFDPSEDEWRYPGAAMSTGEEAEVAELAKALSQVTLHTVLPCILYDHDRYCVFEVCHADNFFQGGDSSEWLDKLTAAAEAAPDIDDVLGGQPIVQFWKQVRCPPPPPCV